MPTIAVQCTNYDPKTVLVTITPPVGDPYSFQMRPEDYAVLALLPGFPPNPCEGT